MKEAIVRQFALLLRPSLATIPSNASRTVKKVKEDGG